MDCFVRNANYRRVMAILEGLLQKGGRDEQCCRCQQCVNDIAALALNYLPPHYFTEERREAELGSPWMMVEAAVRDAIERVRMAPHHERSSQGASARRA